MRVDFSFDFPKDFPRPTPGLYLLPVDKKGSGTWVYLSPDDTGREHGPFPSGNYEASIIAASFVPEPASIPINIEEGSIPRIQFTMKPVGYIRGYVAKKEQPYMQAGEDRPPDDEVEIQSVTLKGNGVYRTLIPLEEAERNYSELYPEYYLSQTDYSFQGTFFFFGLPAGEYELTINTKGYAPHSETCNVIPGQYQNTVIVEPVKEVVDSQ